MREVVNTYYNLIFRVGAVLVILSSLFLFSNLFSEFYETPKLIVLLLFTGLLLVLLTLKFTLAGRVTLTRTPLDLPLLLLLAVAIISTILSPALYVALLGNQLRFGSSLVALITLVLFYFLLTNSLKSLKEVRFLILIMVVSSALLSVISLLAYFGMTLLPKPWTHGINFTTTGSNFSTTAILAMLLPVLVMGIFTGANQGVKILNSALMILFGLTIALTGTWASYIGALVGLGLVLVINLKKLPSKIETAWKDINVWLILLPIVVVAAALAASFIPLMGKVSNPFYNQAKNFPREIQLSLPISWKISVSAFRDSPFWGTSPSTYLFNFTNYKPIEFNSEKFWNLRFDAPFNQYLEILGTLGGIGLLAFLSLTALFLTSAWKTITLSKFRDTHPLTVILAVSGLVFFVILALHSSSLVVWVVGLIILASFMAINLSEAGRSNLGSQGAGFKQVLMKLVSNVSSMEASTETLRVDALPSILLVLALSVAGVSFFFGGKFVLADYHHRQALNAVAQNQGVIAYNELIASEKLNPVNDLYRTDLAQTNFALANAIALAKAPTEASPAGFLTDQDKQNIQVLLQQSVNEGRSATALSPRSTVNWEILGALYRQIAGVAQNALVFSLDAYGRAIFQDPLNPQLRLNVGGTYYAIKNYDLAIRFFTDSINLKPDFANGYYNLSVALRDKGDLNSALQAAQKVVELVDKDSQDYKVATDYLSDLKNKISPPTPAEPPAAQTTGALQKSQLPKVVNVGNPPEKIATPEAIKKPSPTPTPTP